MAEVTVLAGGRYEVAGTIAAGAMGAVLRGRRGEDGEEVAIKRLLDPAQAVRFEIEARLLSRLDHPRVVRVLEHFVDGGDSYLVMELVPGDDLRRVVDREGRPGLPLHEAIRYARETCEALEYVHAQRVVHRDVKPQNLIRGERGVVLVDFGIAREAAGAATLTVGAGTPGYMAPEVAAGGLASPRSDVYGVAATLWALATGRPPAYGRAPALSSVVEGAGPEHDAALRGGLALDPATRLPSAAAFARALGAPLHEPAGKSLARTVERPRAPAALLAAIARAVAGVLDATAVSLGFTDEATGELVYEAAWGAGAHQIVGVRVPPGVGVAGAALTGGEPVVSPECRTDPRFARAVAARTGYIPHTMVVVPIRAPGLPPGVVQALDRSDGRPYTLADLPRAEHAAELAVMALAAGGGETNTVAPM